MKVPINDLSRHLKLYDSKIKSAINRVLESGWLVLGPEVDNFELDFSKFVGVQHSIGVANGTDALELALRACEISNGDRVATVANAGMYTTTAILAVGANPHFMDVDLSTRNACLEDVYEAVESGVDAIVITHLYGLSHPDIATIAALCSSNGVWLIEDCAQAHGARLGAKHVGSFGDIGCFSFYPTKNLGALGDGGAVVTNNVGLAKRVNSLRQYGWVDKYSVANYGGRNSRLDELQAAVLSIKLKYLDKMNIRRREIAQAYNVLINESSHIVKPTWMGEEYVSHLYVINCVDRNSLVDHLKHHEVGFAIHYPILDYKQPIIRFHYPDIFLEHSEKLTSEVLTLPCYPEITDSEIEYVADVINGWHS